jgi:hypothetical protein
MKRYYQSYQVWPIFYYRLVIDCPIVTIVLREAHIITGPVLPRPGYGGISWKYVKQIRLIVSAGPPSREAIVRRQLGPWEIQEFIRLVYMILLPIVKGATVPVTVYLFRPFGSGGNRMDMFSSIMTAALTKPDQNYSVDFSIWGDQNSDIGQLVYDIKTLDQYIEEGWEDELLAEELQYWREEYKRRKDLIKADAEKGQVVTVGGEGESVSISSDP